MNKKGFDEWFKGMTRPLVRELNEEGYAAKSDYEDIGGCSCHLGGAPCSSCCHPGHPSSLEETPEFWDWV